MQSSCFGKTKPSSRAFFAVKKVETKGVIPKDELEKEKLAQKKPEDAKQSGSAFKPKVESKGQPPAKQPPQKSPYFVRNADYCGHLPLLILSLCLCFLPRSRIQGRRRAFCSQALQYPHTIWSISAHVLPAFNLCSVSKCSIAHLLL